MLTARIGDTFFLISLLRAEIDRLEKIGRLESRMYAIAPADRPAVQEKIDAVLEEVASLNRTIQECRATHDDRLKRPDHRRNPIGRADVIW
jgi:hypothetical protein